MEESYKIEQCFALQCRLGLKSVSLKGPSKAGMFKGETDLARLQRFGCRF